MQIKQNKTPPTILPVTKSNQNLSNTTKVPLPLLLLPRRKPVRALAHENRHVAQIDAEALSETLAFATGAGLAVQPGTGRATKTALAVPLPRQSAGVTVAEVAGVAAHRTGAARLLLLVGGVVSVLGRWLWEAVALVRVFGFGADGAAAGGDGEGVGEDGREAVGAAGWAESAFLVCSVGVSARL